MSKLVWDEVGKRLYETGVSKGVLYPQSNGTYPKGAAWSGLTAVNEAPEGAEANPIGDAVLYDWNDNGVGDCTGYADHIGIIIEVNKSQGYFIVMEGNYKDSVRRRKLSINGRYIRGFVTPKYTDNVISYVPPTKTDASVKSERSGYMFNPEVVKLGSEGTSVLLAQEIFRARGFKGKDGKELSLDRKAGTNTVYAIKQYQKSRGLTVDGICGTNTWKDLIAI